MGPLQAGLQGPPACSFQEKDGPRRTQVCRGLQPGAQGPASKSRPQARRSWASFPAFSGQILGGSQGAPCLKALTRRFAAARGQDPSRGPPGRSLSVGFRVFPSRGKSMYIVYIWPTGVAGGRAVYGKSPEGLYTSILHRLLPLSYPVRV